jgi:hypothetical protein
MKMHSFVTISLSLVANQCLIIETVFSADVLILR